MNFVKTDIPDVVLVVPNVFEDARGYFKETWNAAAFADVDIDVDFVQDNQSRSVKGTLRGLHYQIEQPQGKLIRVLVGEIFDVAVDLRKTSNTFGKWVGRILSASNHEMIWIPPGFAHGFYVLSETADIFYKCTEFYASSSERTIAWDDKDLAIDWPLVDAGSPILSEKDMHGTPFSQADYFS